jgi:hypothetical protein
MSLGGARCDAHCNSKRSLSRAGRGTSGFEEVGNRLNDYIRATSFQDCHQIRAPPIWRSDEVTSHFLLRAPANWSKINFRNYLAKEIATKKLFLMAAVAAVILVDSGEIPFEPQ